MNLGAAARRAARLAAGRDTAERVAALASVRVYCRGPAWIRHWPPGSWPRLPHRPARMVSQAYRLPVSETEQVAIEYAACAQRRLVAEQLRRATQAIQRQTRSWGRSVQAAPAGPVTAARKDG